MRSPGNQEIKLTDKKPSLNTDLGEHSTRVTDARPDTPALEVFQAVTSAGGSNHHQGRSAGASHWCSCSLTAVLTALSLLLVLAAAAVELLLTALAGLIQDSAYNTNQVSKAKQD